MTRRVKFFKLEKYDDGASIYEYDADKAYDVSDAFANEMVLAGNAEYVDDDQGKAADAKVKEKPRPKKVHDNDLAKMSKSELMAHYTHLTNDVADPGFDKNELIELIRAEGQNGEASEQSQHFIGTSDKS